MTHERRIHSINMYRTPNRHTKKGHLLLLSNVSVQDLSLKV